MWLLAPSMSLQKHWSLTFPQCISHGSSCLINVFQTPCPKFETQYFSYYCYDQADKVLLIYLGYFLSVSLLFMTSNWSWMVNQGTSLTETDKPRLCNWDWFANELIRATTITVTVTQCRSWSSAWSDVLNVLQIVMLNSLSDLHSYVDKGQLTRELGGSLEYCHSQWIHHRTVS